MTAREPGRVDRNGRRCRRWEEEVGEACGFFFVFDISVGWIGSGLSPENECRRCNREEYGNVKVIRQNVRDWL